MRLYEREGEIVRFQELMHMVAAGTGALAVVEGAPGIGKTALLEAVRQRAAEQGFRTLTAIGGELEQDLPFGIVRQLFEPALSAAEPQVFEGAAGFAAPVFDDDTAQSAGAGSAVHGLYWLCSDLAESAPLLLAVDDAHRADEASLRFFSHLARRIGDVPLLLLLAGRPRIANSTLVRALDGLDPVVVELGPLSDDAVSRLVRERMSPDAQDPFCHACARASGGNPFLLHEAITALKAEHVAPVAAGADRVSELTPSRISAAVLERLARLGPDAGKLARAIAVLGPCADVRRPASLAGIEQAVAAELVDELARESILTGSYPLEFVHPLVRTAVYAEGSDARRAEDHRRAAAILRAEAAPVEQLSAHLMASAPAGDPETVIELRAAAQRALAKAAPEIAASCLRRAVAEPPARAELSPLYAELARALGMANRPAEAAETMWTAFELTGDPTIRGQLALDLGAFMMQSGRPAEALEAFDKARTAVGAGELSTRLTTAFAMASIVAMQPPASWIGRLDALAETVGADSDAGRMLLGALAFGACAAGDRTAVQVGELAARAAQGPLPAQDQWMLVNFCGTALAIADRLPEALALFNQGMDDSRRRGDLAQFRYLAVLRSKAALFAGRLMDAEADAQAALALHRLDAERELPLAAAVLVDALVEQGRLNEAETVLIENGLHLHTDGKILIGHFVHMARARLRLRQQRHREALTDLLTCGETLAEAGCINPAFASWRTEAALAHLALGEQSTARDLAEEDLLLAQRFKAPHAAGVALRTIGLIESGTAGLDHLAESVETLEVSTCALEQARSLIEYGSALRRLGYGRDCRDHLYKGLDIAAHCHARTLVANARHELRASGARPRRSAQTGTDALTAGELRVARLAAAGHTNKTIAQNLFVSCRAVESHLTSAYRKLGIHSREELGSALDPEP